MHQSIIDLGARSGLIAINALIFIIWTQGGFGEPAEILARHGLTHGTGIHPTQWVTSIFLHANLLHLVSNMFFLWAFGLVVEGKVGPAVFVALFSIIGVGESAIEQVLLNWTDPSLSFGASSAIFGLMTISLIWAPKNELTVFYWFWMRTGVVDISIQTFAVLLIVLNALTALALGFAVSSELLHLTGALLGAILGWVFLRRRWVDCENWDLFSVLAGRNLRSLDGELLVARPRQRMTRDGRPVRKKKKVSPIKNRVKHIERLRQLLLERKPKAAYDEWRTSRHFDTEWTSLESDILNLATLLSEADFAPEALEVQMYYIEHYPDRADRVRIDVAEMMFHRQKRPTAALQMVKAISEGTLSQDLAARLIKLRRDASLLIDSGHLEIEGLPGV